MHKQPGPAIGALALPLFRLARYQSESFGEVRTEEEIHAELLRAFWLGEFEVVSISDSGVSPMSRSNLLKAVGLVRKHPGFTLLDAGDAVPERVVANEDGSVSINLTNCVFLPKDRSHWTDRIREDAYGELAKRSFDDFHDNIKPVLFALAVRKEDYGRHCDQRGLARPAFWFAVPKHSEDAKRTEKDLEVWIKPLFSGPRVPKAQLRSRARAKFPAISDRAFDRVWTRLAPKHWTKGGALGKRRDQGSKAK